MTTRFAFAGRCSTEDLQDPESSRAWQITRAEALIGAHGQIVAEFFDSGQSRSIPWARRPRAAALLDALKDPHRSFDAVVIGEPQRAFYGNQFGLTFPIFTHYGVPLWVPEVGGPVDPESEAHDMVMSVFGGMSKGERTRIKIRVRTAMSAQTKLEGRFLGGRPPYGYRLADAGAHPNPTKAADGRRLHRLEPDKDTAAVVQRIFVHYSAGRGLYAIAEALTRAGIPCPSAHDRARNRHRSGVAWSKGAVRVILTNPRYTGHQVWNKQRKDEVLIDVDNVALGHETKLRWNDKETWVWSTSIVHEPLIDMETFQAVQQMLAGKGTGRKHRERQTTRHPYVFRGLLRCGICNRRMQGQQSKLRLYYRCRFPNEYSLANTVDHPRNVYLNEADLLPRLDDWLAGAFAADRLADTIDRMQTAQPDITPAPAAESAARVIADCDAKLARYREALEAGTDPKLVAAWTAEVQARRAEAAARSRKVSAQRRMTREEIHRMIKPLGSIRETLATADPEAKADVYRSLGLTLTYQPEKQLVRVAASLDPHELGIKSVSEGGLEPPRP
ncbi:recombinase family protein [Streptomyces sp. NBRC 109706]|uniref:recombinase family protein n=1 Tax=Streptomyces sp. NBRC 109706 TaxID=1550035 RepID=UPI00099B367C|nr:recombinase family protein [Streptomyces sp. NBRC 109706]